MSKKFYFIIFGLLCVLNFIILENNCFASGTTYYVSTSGNDANTGLKGSPWRTPGFASKQLHVGDTLIIRQGEYVMDEYYTDMITPENSGTASNWITIMGEKGKRPVLKASNNLLATISFNQKSYLKFKNLKITSLIDNPYSGGVRVGIDAGGASGESSYNNHIIFKNIDIYDTEQGGINFSGNINDVVMDKLIIHHVGGNAIAAPSAYGGLGWQNVLIKNSRVSYAGYFMDGMRQVSDWSRPDGIGMEVSNGPLTIRNSVFQHNRGDGIDSKSKNTYIYNTIIANNTSDSLKLWGGGSKVKNVLIYGDGDSNADNGPWSSITIGTDTPGDFEFINVTVDDNEARNNYPSYMQYSETAEINVLMRNCIFAHGSEVIFMGDSVNLTADHNNFYRSSNSNEPVIHVFGKDYLPSELNLLGNNNYSVEPLFKQRAWGSDGDYRLKKDSLMIDKGSTNKALNVDLLNVKRPQKKAYDLGAYERCFGYCKIRGSILINNNAKTTKSKKVTLNLSATTGVKKMRFSDNGKLWTAWIKYQTKYSWDLTKFGGIDKKGTKYVYVQFKNHNRLTKIKSDKIIWK